jgi:hypothetical protein
MDIAKIAQSFDSRSVKIPCGNQEDAGKNSILSRDSLPLLRISIEPFSRFSTKVPLLHPFIQ